MPGMSMLRAFRLLGRPFSTLFSAVERGDLFFEYKAGVLIMDRGGVLVIVFGGVCGAPDSMLTREENTKVDRI